jgi:hypothetical protein
MQSEGSYRRWWAGALLVGLVVAVPASPRAAESKNVDERLRQLEEEVQQLLALGIDTVLAQAYAARTEAAR